LLATLRLIRRDVAWAGQQAGAGLYVGVVVVGGGCEFTEAWMI